MMVRLRLGHIARLTVASILLTAGNTEAEPARLSVVEVSELIALVKGDPERYRRFCHFIAVSDRYETLDQNVGMEEKRKLERELEEAADNAGPEVERLLSSEVEETAEGAIEEFAASCP